LNSILFRGKRPDTESVSNLRFTLIAVPFLLSGLCEPALAYVGPGAGVTMLGALWAVIVAVVFVIGGLLIWPIRMLLRKTRPGEQIKTPENETTVAKDNAGGESAESAMPGKLAQQEPDKK